MGERSIYILLISKGGKGERAVRRDHNTLLSHSRSFFHVHSMRLLGRKCIHTYIHVHWYIHEQEREKKIKKRNNFLLQQLHYYYSVQSCPVEIVHLEREKKNMENGWGVYLELGCPTNNTQRMEVSATTSCPFRITFLTYFLFQFISLYPKDLIIFLISHFTLFLLLFSSVFLF